MTPGFLDLGAQPRILFLNEHGAPRHDVSTDEITPVAIMSHYDERLARFPYTGFKSEGKLPIGPGDVVAGGYTVTVAGRRYGKGSSREHSPAAEKLAGIRLVVAESFERIYRQNADNIGLFTSTDMGLAAWAVADGCAFFRCAWPNRNRPPARSTPAASASRPASSSSMEICSPRCRRSTISTSVEVNSPMLSAFWR